MAKTILLISLVFLVTMTDFSHAVNRKIMTVEGKAAVDMAAEVRISAYNEKIDINNHHSIPRDSWDNDQDPDAPAATHIQDKDRKSPAAAATGAGGDNHG